MNSLVCFNLSFQLHDSEHDLKTVMVFIFGGGYMIGNSRTDKYGPEMLLTQDIVLVTLNYRTGIFGRTMNIYKIR